MLTLCLLLTGLGLLAYAMFNLAPVVSARLTRTVLLPRTGSREPHLTVMLEGWDRWIPWVLFLVALGLRLAFLDSIPNTVTADELDFARDQLAILHGQGPVMFGLDWTGSPDLEEYARNVAWILFGHTLFSLRLLSAVLTALAVIPFYRLARRLVTIPAATAGSFIFASTWLLLLFGRSAWNNGDIVAYMLWALWALTAALERNRSLFWGLYGLSLALLLYGYFAGRTVVLAFALYFPVLLVERVRAKVPGNLRTLLEGALFAAAVCFALFLPELRTILANPVQFNTRVAATSILGHRPPGESLPQIFSHQIAVTVNSFFLMDRSTGGRYKGVGMAWLDWITMVFFYIGLVVGLIKLRATVMWWLLLLIPLTATQLLTIDIPNGARAIPVIAPMCFFATLGIDFLLRLTRKVEAISQVALIGLTLTAAGLNVHDFVLWIDSPVAMSERRPAVSSDSFNTWVQFQQARLDSNLPMLNADQYQALSKSTIASQIASARSKK